LGPGACADVEVGAAVVDDLDLDDDGADDVAVVFDFEPHPTRPNAERDDGDGYTRENRAERACARL